MKRRSTIFSLATGFALLLSAFAPTCFAQTKSVLVQRRDGDITILANGDAQFVETWEVQFIGGPFTFAFRSIPLGRLTDIADWGVSENGDAYQQSEGDSPNTFTVSSEGGEKKITWHFPQTTDATRTFTLSYTVKGAIRLADSGDELFWKFVESDRAYSINTSRVVVHLPVAFEAGQLEVNTAGRVVDGQTVEYSGGPFEPGAVWEIQVRFPHGAVSGGAAAEPVADAPPPAANANTLPFNLIDAGLAVLILGGGTFQLYRLWKKYGQYQLANMPADLVTMPPDNLSPALAGALLNQREDVQLIVATVVDLAQRSKIRIEFAGRDDYIFHRLEDDLAADLRPFERALLTSLFHRDTQKLSDVRERFHQEIPYLTKKLYEELSESGYIMPGPQNLARKYWLWGLVLVVAPAFVAFCLLPSGLLLTLCIASMYPFSLLVLSRFLSSRTEKGAAAATKWRAFKKHLAAYKTLERDGAQIDRYLPYAIALGLQRKWVARFSARYAADSDGHMGINLFHMADTTSAALAGHSAGGSEAGGYWGGSDGGGSDGGGDSGFG